MPSHDVYSRARIQWMDIIVFLLPTKYNIGLILFLDCKEQNLLERPSRACLPSNESERPLRLRNQFTALL